MRKKKVGQSRDIMRLLLHTPKLLLLTPMLRAYMDGEVSLLRKATAADGAGKRLDAGMGAARDQTRPPR